MTPRKPWYSHLTVDKLIKYFTLAAMVTGMLTAVGKVVAIPYMKTEMKKEIEINNVWLEQQYAGKNELLIKIYESQKITSEQMTTLQIDVAKIKGKLER